MQTKIFGRIDLKFSPPKKAEPISFKNLKESFGVTRGGGQAHLIVPVS